MADNAPTPEAWEIHASSPLVFPSGRVLYPTRVLCGDSLVGELVLTLPQLDRFAGLLGLRRLGAPEATGSFVPWGPLVPRFGSGTTGGTKVVDLRDPESVARS